MKLQRNITNLLILPKRSTPSITNSRRNIIQDKKLFELEDLLISAHNDDRLFTIANEITSS